MKVRETPHGYREAMVFPATRFPGDKKGWVRPEGQAGLVGGRGLSEDRKPLGPCIQWLNTSSILV